MDIVIDRQKTVIQYNYVSAEDAVKAVGGIFGYLAFFLFIAIVAFTFAVSFAFFFAMATLISKKFNDAKICQAIRVALAKFKTVASALADMQDGSSTNAEILRELNYYLELDYDTLTYEETELAYQKIN